MIYSVDLLKLMGTSIAADIVAENHVCNEQKLWRHVILNAFEDTKALMSAERKASSSQKCDAHYLDSIIIKILNRSVGGQGGNRITFDIDITKR